MKGAGMGVSSLPPRGVTSERTMFTRDFLAILPVVEEQQTLGIGRIKEGEKWNSTGITVKSRMRSPFDFRASLPCEQCSLVWRDSDRGMGQS